MKFVLYFHLELKYLYGKLFTFYFLNLNSPFKTDCTRSERTCLFLLVSITITNFTFGKKYQTITFHSSDIFFFWNQRSDFHTKKQRKKIRFFKKFFSFSASNTLTQHVDLCIQFCMGTMRTKKGFPWKTGGFNKLSYKSKRLVWTFLPKIFVSW